jgi:hypothetical protein
MSSTASSIVIDYNEWDTSKVKYMAPKVNERGGSSINIISTQSNRGLHITTPMMMTWGISDYIDEKTGESDGKYTLSLAFPNKEYETPEVREFLEKFKAFEEQILSDAEKNSTTWWKGPKKSREVLEFTYFPSLKYSRNKETHEIDYNRPPGIRAKVPFYSNKWDIEVYDLNSNLIFPSETAIGSTPADFVPKSSMVACVLKCAGIWIGGKGWGVSWKCIQCAVKPRENMNVMGVGKCFLKISPEDRAAAAGGASESSAAAPAQVSAAATATAEIQGVIVEDSDDDEPAAPIAPTPAPVAAPPAPEPVVEAPPPAPAAEPIKKKTVVKKKVVGA